QDAFTPDPAERHWVEPRISGPAVEPGPMPAGHGKPNPAPTQETAFPAWQRWVASCGGWLEEVAPHTHDRAIIVCGGLAVWRLMACLILVCLGRRSYVSRCLVLTALGFSVTTVGWLIASGLLASVGLLILLTA